MKISTYYKIFYKNRIKKSKIFLKIYLILIIPFRYLINIPYMKKEINLDELAQK